MLTTAHFERYANYMNTIIKNTKSFLLICKSGIEKVYGVSKPYILTCFSLIHRMPIIGYICNIIKSRLSKPQIAISPKPIVDVLQEYMDNRKKQWDKLYEPDVDICIVNRNIIPLFYKKGEFLEYMKNENTDLEREWRTRILFEYTPRGNIVMYYDAYKQGFAYYSDITMTYNVLNSVAMKYVGVYGCRDFFIDNQYRDEESPFLEIYEKDAKPTKEDKESAPKMDNKVFAKLKNYNTVSSKVNAATSDKPTVSKMASVPLKERPITKIDSLSMPKIAISLKKEEVIPDKMIWKNRFVYCGKMVNCKLLQKVETRAKMKAIPLGNIEKHDGEIESQSGLTKELLNYRAFKEMKLKQQQNSIPSV